MDFKPFENYDEPVMLTMCIKGDTKIKTRKVHIKHISSNDSYHFKTRHKFCDDNTKEFYMIYKDYAIKVPIWNKMGNNDVTTCVVAWLKNMEVVNAAGKNPLDGLKVMLMLDFLS